MRDPGDSAAGVAMATMASTALPSQCFAYSSTLVTDCTPAATPSAPLSSTPSATVTVTMPECPDCGCSQCTYTHTYTTTYPLFCPSGTVPHTYTVEEIYSGVSTKPALPPVTGVPSGFTTGVETCTLTCGASALTRTLTYPIGGPTFLPEGKGTAHTDEPTANPGKEVPLQALASVKRVPVTMAVLGCVAVALLA